MSGPPVAKSQLIFFPKDVVDHPTKDVVVEKALSVNSLAFQMISVLSLLLLSFLSSLADLYSRSAGANVRFSEGVEKKTSEVWGWTSARMEEDSLKQRELILDLLVPYKTVTDEEIRHIKFNDDEPECEVLSW